LPTAPDEAGSSTIVKAKLLLTALLLSATCSATFSTPQQLSDPASLRFTVNTERTSLT
jgi:hypothetical protein